MPHGAPVQQDPYVRKTAAVCVAKLYDINAELVEDQGFLQILRDLICDPNPTVRAFLWLLLLRSCFGCGHGPRLFTGRPTKCTSAIKLIT